LDSWSHILHKTSTQHPVRPTRIPGKTKVLVSASVLVLVLVLELELPREVALELLQTVAAAVWRWWW
jgi:hypothetical protein